ncbi:UpxY family transcription antiterminator [Aquimarina intermedia]|uniref:Transcription antitermination factor NusG n=1 Tax=Aquimarina intermedia TaxID=350814 RepID=A0A5S5C4V3_9FLAO|nr:UpxY family transcription antiterminator [Aquimarina intermedia]TYP74364.1 transcription antitermination factor NusG [Aquimarina intermedia]
MKFFTKGWHVIYVKSRQERKVYDSLMKMSIESFLPLVKTVRQWSDRKKTIEIPLFPSYVFVNIHSSLDFYRALSVEGACAYIRFGNDYAVVRDSEIEKVRILLNIDGVTDIATTEVLPKVGEIRKVEYGPLVGLECEVLRVDNKDMILVRIDSLDKNISATLSSSILSDCISSAI